MSTASIPGSIDPERPPGDEPAGETAVIEAGTPERYLHRSDEEGPYLTSRETPEVRVRLRAELSVTAAAARKAPEGTIFLDGAAQGEPFLDHDRRVFNLDHHEGVIRRFTLSACEQAAVLVLRGLDLRERPWTIFANQPDLDTVLAIWVLLNSVHLGEDRPDLRRACMPLIRVEGLIDSQGLGLMEFSGMDEEHLQRTVDQIEELREIELSALAEGGAGEDAGVASLVAQLEAIDRMVYPADFFQALPAVEELALAELSEDRIVVVCRCACGIYEAEPVLKRLYGKRLAVVALERQEGYFTLRQVDTFLPGGLNKAYRTLNLFDPSVRNSRATNRWGGSGEIGGSPRSSPTALRPAEIAAACRRAYRRPSLRQRATAVGRSLLASSLPMFAGLVAVTLGLSGMLGRRLLVEWAPAVLAGVVVAVCAIALLLLKAARHPGVFGLRLPVGWKWLWLAPAAVAAALLGGAWPVGLAPPARLLEPASLLAVLLLPLAAELNFRALAQGLLIERLPLAESGRLLSPSWPAVASAVFYAAWTLPLAFFRPGLEARPLGEALAVSLVALLLGLVLGICRERGESLLPPLLLHWAGVAAAVGIALVT